VVDDRKRHTRRRGTDDRVHAPRQHLTCRAHSDLRLSALIRRHRLGDRLTEHTTRVVDLLDRELHRLDLRRPQGSELARLRQHVPQVQHAIATVADAATPSPGSPTAARGEHESDRAQQDRRSPHRWRSHPPPPFVDTVPPPMFPSPRPNERPHALDRRRSTVDNATPGDTSLRPARHRPSPRGVRGKYAATARRAMERKDDAWPDDACSAGRTGGPTGSKSAVSTCPARTTGWSIRGGTGAG